MKKLYTAFLLVLLAALLGVGIYSLADQDGCLLYTSDAADE